MRHLIVLLLSAVLALPVLAAERMQRLGEVEAHYSVFNSSFLQPEIAKASGLTRSKELGVLNLSFAQQCKGQVVKLSGTVTDLMSKTTPLTFRETKEGSAVYYLAQFKQSSREILKFKIEAEFADGQRHTLQFSQEVFPD